MQSPIPSKASPERGRSPRETLGQTKSVALFGVDALPVRVEARILPGVKRFSIVGLADSVVREAKERVRCAIESSGYPFPSGDVVVSLAPAGLPKSGSSYDVAIAISVLAAAGIVPSESLKTKVIIGELGLDGSINSVRGVLSAACFVGEQSAVTSLLVPSGNRSEGELVENVDLQFISSLSELVLHLNGACMLSKAKVKRDEHSSCSSPRLPNFDDVVGQQTAKRALEIAAAGSHNVLLIGPPGSGKSMLAERLPSILSPLTRAESLEVTKIASVSNLFSRYSGRLIDQRPFRSPHHSTSTSGLVGGGSTPTPGEITLAHKGVLFLDEFVEFRRTALEALRQPMETGRITISRAKASLTFPASFMLVAASNPCPCGRLGSPHPCRCSAVEVARYRAKYSGPILDRIDLCVWVAPIDTSEFSKHRSQNQTAKMRSRVKSAETMQSKRFLTPSKRNAHMSSDECREFVNLSPEAEKFLLRASGKLMLSARSYSRVLKLCRTIADIEQREQITPGDVAEAVSYRFSE